MEQLQQWLLQHDLLLTYLVFVVSVSIALLTIAAR